MENKNIVLASVFPLVIAVGIFDSAPSRKQRSNKVYFGGLRGNRMIVEILMILLFFEVISGFPSYQDNYYED